MQRHRGVRNSRGPSFATEEAKRFPPRYGPSSSSELRDIDPPILAMASSNADDRHDFLQVVNDVISASLIDDVVRSLGSGSTTSNTFTELKWTDACENLLRTYRGQIHPTVCPASNGDLDSVDVLIRSLTNHKSPPSSNPPVKRSGRSR